MLKYTYIIFSSLLILSACKDNKPIATPEYWDSKQFFLAEIVQLNKLKAGLTKELTFNESQQKIVMQNVDWAKELNAFVELDFKRNGYKGRFDIDTIAFNDTTHKVIYVANDEKLDLRKVEILCHTLNRKIISVEIGFNEQSTVYTSSKKYKYLTNKLFAIEGKQQVKLGNNASYAIIGSIESAIVNQQLLP